MKAGKDRGPGVRIPPPLIFLLYIFLSYVLHSYFPLPLAWPAFTGLVALCFIVSGIGIAAISAVQFWRAKTHIEPWQPATALITTGIFSYSRNPIYLSFILITIGLGCYLKSVWVIVSAIPAALSVYKWVIIKEEAYLEQKFGESFREYKSQVRRWL